MWLLYYAGLYVMVLVIHITSIWNQKSRQWIQGRKNWKDDLKKISPKQNPRVWFHVSSLGEFEQGKPVIEKLKKHKPETEIILSFFSPSGYLSKQHYPIAKVIYLPSDLPGNAALFVRSINPDIAVFVKYDLWPGYLKSLSKHDIPAILISANWSAERKFASWSNPLTMNLLKGFRKIFLQRKEHLEYFIEKGFNNLSVAGDTRIDRAVLLPDEVHSRLPAVLKDSSYDLVAGSTWPEDEELIIHAIQQLNLRTIIAPHDVSPSNIARLTKRFTFPYQLLSRIGEKESPEKVIVVDSIGLLSVLYAMGKLAYVGGGFGKGIHNILEPAAHRKAVIFGPRYEKFPEAGDMIAVKGAVSVSTKEEFIEVLKSIQFSGKAEEAGNKTFAYLEENAGATEIVTRYILESIP